MQSKQHNQVSSIDRRRAASRLQIVLINALPIIVLILIVLAIASSDWAPT